MAPLIAERGCPVILMHSRKTPHTMQVDPIYDDVVREVMDELLACVKDFTGRGVLRENIILDPGLGFAKRFEDNIEILRHLSQFSALKFPILIGASRKSFIGRITGKEAQRRLWGTLGSVAAAYIHGADIFRVHDVGETKDFLDVLSVIEDR
jgi:dihydropteroate synthase